MTVPKPSSPPTLRSRAEQIAAQDPADFEALSPEARRSLVHELRVHQIELEMQNEELRRSQDELEVSRARYFDLYDLAPVGYCTVSEEGLIVLANLTIATLLGVARGQLAKRPLSSFLFAGDEDAWYLRKKKLLATGEPQWCELRMVKPGGEPFWVHLSATLARDPSPARTLNVVVSDLTEHKQAEAARSKLEGQLHHAQKLEFIGRLSGGVAHDFNNMLAVVLLHAEAGMDRTSPGTPLHADLVEIKKAARRSADLTQQLLAFARRQPSAPEVVDLNERVEQVLTLLRPLVGAQIQLTTQAEPQLWPINMDPTQVDQVLSNLCLNARDAIPDVGVISLSTSNVVLDERHCAAHPDSRPGPYVRLTVSDTGTGMDAQTVSQVFEPFFTTKPVGQGTGLGLATVQGVVTQNGGCIEVSSQVGRGTTFVVYLPQYLGAPRLAPAEQAVTRPSGAPGHETILVVEDEPAILRVATRLLRGQGYTVLGAATPEEALRLAKAEPTEIHLLMTDVIMPGMNGRDLASAVLAFRPAVKCLFMSGYTADIISARGLLDDAVHFMQKPFSAAELTAAVRAALDVPVPANAPPPQRPS